MKNHKINHLTAFFLCLLVVTTSNISFAQDFRLGFKGNPLISTVKPTTDKHSSVGSKIGFSYGLMFDYFIKDNYAISSEFGISSMGGNMEYSSADTTVSTELKLRYIEIPVSIKLRTNEISENLKVYGKFGLNLGFRIKSEANIDYKESAGEYAKDAIKNANDYTQPFNIALNIGAGVEYSLAENLDLIAGITYCNGFTNIMKSRSVFKADPNVSKFSANINYIALNIGLLF